LQYPGYGLLFFAEEAYRQAAKEVHNWILAVGELLPDPLQWRALFIIIALSIKE
jgi:hypothetical protein